MASFIEKFATDTADGKPVNLAILGLVAFVIMTILFV